ncbi:CesT family type III secretion system chaperone [uncultured Hydrogenophaga sp.]|uniref:CesT family type III secretion system chaperone n=1 Tax=uncultured Hydrogenophaga sp. TaxID=199683 RepID=UPI00265E3E8C|nr:CesT family type III secretion system chaperone [uncultured Hydrogenophaga sp.]
MNLLAFQSLCRHVSQSLAADDIDALGESRPTTIQGETFELLYPPEGRDAVLLTYLGRVDDEHARPVYEQLLLVQLTGWNNPDLRFGFDPVTGQVLLCTRLPAVAELQEDALKALIERLLAQIEPWRGELLKPLQVETPFARFMTADEASAASPMVV